jgi:hypothetical protein
VRRALIRALAGVLLLIACRSTDPPPPRPAAATAKLPCGPDLNCDPRVTYCEIINTDVPALPSSYSCRVLPEACAAKTAEASIDCGCFPPETRCPFCVPMDVGAVHTFRRTCVGQY